MAASLATGIRQYAPLAHKAPGNSPAQLSLNAIAIRRAVVEYAHLIKIRDRRETVPLYALDVLLSGLGNVDVDAGLGELAYELGEPPYGILGREVFGVDIEIGPYEPPPVLLKAL